MSKEQGYRPDDAPGNDGQGEPANDPVVPDYSGPARGDPARLVTVRRMRVIEAQLAKAKLESEGIPCDIADQEMAITHPLVISEVRLQVRQADAERAIEILDRHAADDAEGEYVHEEWRCPQCRRRAVDLLPPSAGHRRVRAGCLVLIAIPVILTILSEFIDDRGFEDWVGTVAMWGVLPWGLTLVVLTILVVSFRRRKRCRTCGHEWEGNPQDAADE